MLKSLSAWSFQLTRAFTYEPPSQRCTTLSSAWSRSDERLSGPAQTSFSWCENEAIAERPPALSPESSRR
jgi:hypothetical protein